LTILAVGVARRIASTAAKRRSQKTPDLTA
jgi:hypothetical protein